MHLITREILSLMIQENNLYFTDVKLRLRIPHACRHKPRCALVGARVSHQQLQVTVAIATFNPFRWYALVVSISAPQNLKNVGWSSVHGLLQRIVLIGLRTNDSL